MGGQKKKKHGICAKLLSFIIGACPKVICFSSNRDINATTIIIAN
jgi:hypothetical protein